MAKMKAGRYANPVILGSALGPKPEDGGEGKTPFVAIQFENAERDTITAYLYMSEKAWPYTKEKLQKMGWDADARGHRFEELDAEPSPLCAAKVDSIVVEDEFHDGKTHQKVKFINIGGFIERMEPAQAKSFAATLRQRLLGGGGGGFSTAKEQDQFGREMEQLEKTMPGDDSDPIPF